jgi:omega-amidase
MNKFSNTIRDEISGGYVAYGHSTLVNAWGDVVVKAEAGADVVVADIDFSTVESVRDNIPCWKQKRPEVYSQSV